MNTPTMTQMVSNVARASINAVSITDVQRNTYELEPINIMLGHIVFYGDPGSTAVSTGALSKESMNVRPREAGGVTATGRDNYDFRVEFGGQDRFPLDEDVGDSIYRTTGSSSAFTYSVSLSVVRDSSETADSAFIAIPVQILRQANMPDATAVYVNIQTKMFQLLGQSIDTVVTYVFDNTHYVNEFSPGNEQAGFLPRDGETDGVKQFTSDIDFTTRTEAQANDNAYAIRSEIIQPLMDEGSAAYDNYYILAPMWMVTYFTYYSLAGRKRITAPLPGYEHSVGTFRDTVSKMVAMDGFTIVGMPDDVLGAYDDTGSGGETGVFAYAYERGAFVLTFDQNRDPNDRFRDTTGIYSSVGGFNEAIQNRLETTNLMYDAHAQHLLDLKKRGGNWYDEASMIPTDTVLFEHLNLGSKDTDHNGLKARMSITPTRLAPKKMMKIKLPDSLSAGSSFSSARSKKLRNSKTNASDIRGRRRNMTTRLKEEMKSKGDVVARA